MDGHDIREAIRQTEIEGLDLLSADKNLIGVNLELVTSQPRIHPARPDERNKKRIQYHPDRLPAGLRPLTLNALMAADAVLGAAPMRVFCPEGDFEPDGHDRQGRESFGHPLEIEGILLTMYDDRTNLTRQVAADLSEFFGRSLQDDHSPQRPIGRGAQPRQTDPALRSELQRVGSLYTARKRGSRKMTKNDPRKALGKGPAGPAARQRRRCMAPPARRARALKVGSVQFIPIERVIPNPNQPRRDFDATALMELTQSIEREGSSSRSGSANRTGGDIKSSPGNVAGEPPNPPG